MEHEGVGRRGAFLVVFYFFSNTPLRKEKKFDMIQHAGRRAALLRCFLSS
jgi:hypothetical protein